MYVLVHVAALDKGLQYSGFSVAIVFGELTDFYNYLLFVCVWLFQCRRLYNLIYGNNISFHFNFHGSHIQAPNKL
jgi:hypothetical protein